MGQSSVNATLIGSVPLFTELDEGDCQKLANIGQRVVKKAGERIFQEGERSTFFLVVLEGRVSLSMRPDARQEATVLTLVPGELVGWSALFGGDRVATAKALCETALLVFNGDELSQLCHDDHDIGYAVMNATCIELARRLRDTRLQLIDVFRGPPPSGHAPISTKGQ